VFGLGGTREEDMRALEQLHNALLLAGGTLVLDTKNSVQPACAGLGRAV
jgi:hypothetical protein